MPLDSTFKYADLIDKVRHVRTPEGSRYFDAPIGTPITADLKLRAKLKREGTKSKTTKPSTPKPSGKPGSSAKPANTGGSKSPGKPSGAAAPKAPKVRPTGAGKMSPTHPKYKKRMGEYDKAISEAKDGQALQRVVARLKNDLIVNDDDYRATLDRIQDRGVELGALKARTHTFTKPKTPEKPADKAPVDRVVDRPKADPPKAEKKPLDRPVEDRPAADRPTDTPEPPKKAVAPSKRPKDAKPMTMESEKDAAVAASQKRFWAGPDSTIASAPEAGLWNHILTDARFDISRNGSKGQATNFWVKDTTTNETWMFKHTFFDGVTNPGSTEEALNDAMASLLLNEAGMSGSDFKWATAPGQRQGITAQRHWVEQHHGGKGEPIDVADLNAGVLEFHPDAGKGDVAPDAAVLTDSAIEKIRNGKTPDALLHTMLFDYLTNNIMDRHANNLLWVDNGDDTMDVGIIDHGLAFGSVEDAEGIDLRGAAFQGWMEGGYRADDEQADGSFGIVSAAARIAGDRATLRKQVTKALAQFEKSNIDNVFNDLTSKPLSTEQIAYADEWLAEYEERLEHLREEAETIVEYIAKKGGLK